MTHLPVRLGLMEVIDHWGNKQLGFRFRFDKIFIQFWAWRKLFESDLDNTHQCQIISLTQVSFSLMFFFFFSFWVFFESIWKNDLDAGEKKILIPFLKFYWNNFQNRRPNNRTGGPSSPINVILKAIFEEKSNQFQWNLSSTKNWKQIKLFN